MTREEICNEWYTKIINHSLIKKKEPTSSLLEKLSSSDYFEKCGNRSFTLKGTSLIKLEVTSSGCLRVYYNVFGKDKDPLLRTTPSIPNLSIDAILETIFLELCEISGEPTGTLLDHVKYRMQFQSMEE